MFIERTYYVKAFIKTLTTTQMMLCMSSFQNRTGLKDWSGRRKQFAVRHCGVQSCHQVFSAGSPGSQSNVTTTTQGAVGGTDDIRFTGLMWASA